ncbi:MAG: hypothetical protein JOY82_06290 [Streptosporangiaceae bacterium]|nr:hypothetical protein [Streptosporangiaceae bacterium]MBV9854119.1 hypothetical protein [Streptosporangiaceae bacterium]
MTRNGTSQGRTPVAAPAWNRDRYEVTFGFEDLPGIRHLARAYGSTAGLGATRLADFVLAVSECGANALCHGEERAILRLWVASGHVYCEVQGGTWMFRHRPVVIPPDDVESLRLWVLQRVCDDIAVSIGSDGTTVLFSMAVR